MPRMNIPQNKEKYVSKKFPENKFSLSFHCVYFGLFIDNGFQFYLSCISCLLTVPKIWNGLNFSRTDCIGATWKPGRWCNVRAQTVKYCWVGLRIVWPIQENMHQILQLCNYIHFWIYTLWEDFLIPQIMG